MRMASDTQYYLRRSVCLHTIFIEDWSINIIDPALTHTDTCRAFNHIVVLFTLPSTLIFPPVYKCHL